MTQTYQEIMGIGHLSILELIFTHGFIILMLIIWSPVMVYGVLMTYLKSRAKKKEIKRKKEELSNRVRSVA